METGHHIAVAGMGNTGSHLVPELGRMPALTQITLVDPDVYSESNIKVQNVDISDVGQPKVQVQAAKLRLINPELKVIAMQERIEDVPRGRLRCDLLVSCLDSKGARQHLNEISYRVGTPWIDCGILGSLNLARVNGYVPSFESPCLECWWSREEYALVEQEYLCGAGSGAAFPSLASSALGALAASLTAVQITMLLSGDITASVAAKQVVLDARHHRLLVTTIRRNSTCFFDHRTWTIEPWHCRPDRTTVGAALSELGSLQVDGHRFVCGVVCPACGRQESSLRLNRPLARCVNCDRRMVTPGFVLERLDSELPGEYRTLTLAQIGIRDADLVTAGDRHYQITRHHEHGSNEQ